jgi:hypothetical protein
MLRSAATLFTAALEHGRRTVYADGERLAAAEQYLGMIRYIGSSDGESFRSFAMDVHREAYKNDILYIRALSGDPMAAALCSKDGPHRQHLALRERVRQADEGEVREILMELKALLARCEVPSDAVLKYYIYCDLEKLASGCGDYKCAYECSSERLLLAEKMNH